MSVLRKAVAGLLLTGLLLWTIILNIYHIGVYPRPVVDQNSRAEAHWYPRDKHGLNHLVLIGPPFARGREAGRLTAPLLLEQENQLVARLKNLLGSTWLMQGVVLTAIAWFQGVEAYLDLPHLEEMYGTSLSAPHQYDYLADGFTRQVAYHGLHEVGQMMVDQGGEDMGCTVVAIRHSNHYVIGRNFDFEGGRIFDTEKIVKWVFPEQGNAFVSIIWAGMVGAVTGVNQHGLYISLNAAGSSDSKRLGTPSTLVLLKVLQYANTADEAIAILRREQMFITDIFVIEDAFGHTYKIEKSPIKMDVSPILKSTVVTNHLQSPMFRDDSVNQLRMRELTTVARFTRGQQLVDQLPTVAKSKSVALQALGVLRDKGVDSKGRPLHLGNRQAIDALIATHSVIYDPLASEIWISTGPGLSGAFLGYDLKTSFAQKTPVKSSVLPPDPLVDSSTFLAVREAAKEIAEAGRRLSAGHCQEALTELESLRGIAREQSQFYSARGDAYHCLQDSQRAREDWQRALDLTPAYAKLQTDLETQLSLRSKP